MPNVIDRPTLLQEFNLRARNAGLEVIVPSYGPFDTDTAIVGEGAGEQEVRQKMPFVGGAGGVLWSACNKCGVKRHEVFTTNVIKRQISLGRETDARNKVSKGEFEAWAGLLRWELAQLPNLRYVLVLGNYALRALCGVDGITNWRGSVLDIRIGDRTVKAVIAFNPAYVIREPKLEVTLPFDLNKLRLVREGRYSVHSIVENINPTFSEAMEWIAAMRAGGRPVSYDIETLNGHTACYGLSNSPHEGFCINLRTASENRFTAEEEGTLLLALQAMFNDPSVQLIAQNGTFDGYWSWLKDGLKLGLVAADTLLGHHTLYPLLPHNLGFLVSQYTFHPFYKDEGKEWRDGGQIDDFWRYNCKDTALTIAVWNGIRRELQQQGLYDFFTNHVMKLQPHTVRATTYGVAFDVTQRAKLSEELEEQLSKLRADFQSLAYMASGNDERFVSVNPNSPTQLGALFFQKLRLVGRGTSTDVKNRERIKAHPSTPPQAREMIAKLDQYAKEQKFVSTYVNVSVSEDGRMRSEYKQFGTAKAPGRLSSSGLLDGTGTNLQNQPDRAHKLFMADPGCGFVYFDLSQAEARVVGWLARIEKWKEQFERARIDGSYDCHRALASEMWKIPYDLVPTKDRDEEGNPTKRFTAKRCRHGLNYRMGPDRLAETAGLPMSEAIEAYNIYHSITPELRVWWREEEKDARTTKQLWSPLGRRLIIMQRLDDSALESIVAFKPQSTIGDKVCKVWYQSEDDEEWPEHCRIALNVHDALIAHGPLDKLKTAARIMKKHAEQPIIIHGEPLIIPADLKISFADEQGVHRWSNMEKLVL